MMATNVSLRIALIDDLFFNNKKLIGNKIYFEYSNISHCIQGPFTIPEIHVNNLYYLQQFYYKMYYKRNCLYVLDENKSNNFISAAMRQALPDDIKSSRADLKVNFSFWLRKNNEMVGPYSFQHNSNIMDIKTHLDNNEIYIIDSAFNQNNLQIQTRSS